MDSPCSPRFHDLKMWVGKDCFFLQCGYSQIYLAIFFCHWKSEPLRSLVMLQKNVEVLKVISITDHLLLPRVSLWDSSCFVSENILSYLGVFSNHYISRPYCSVQISGSGRRQLFEIQPSDRSCISLSCCFFMPRISAGVKNGDDGGSFGHLSARSSAVN